MGILCNQMISRKNHLVICDTSFVLLHEIECAIFKNQAVTIKMNSWLRLILCNLKTVHTNVFQFITNVDSNLAISTTQVNFRELKSFYHQVSTWDTYI